MAISIYGSQLTKHFICAAKILNTTARAGKARMPNREDPNQTASLEAVWSGFINVKQRKL